MWFSLLSYILRHRLFSPFRRGGGEAQRPEGDALPPLLIPFVKNVARARLITISREKEGTPRRHVNTVSGSRSRSPAASVFPRSCFTARHERSPVGRVGGGRDFNRRVNAAREYGRESFLWF